MQLTLFIAALASMVSALPVGNPNTNGLVARDPSPRLRYNQDDPLNRGTYKHIENYGGYGAQRGGIYRVGIGKGDDIELFDPYSKYGGGVQRATTQDGRTEILNGGARCTDFDENGVCKKAIAK